MFGENGVTEVCGDLGVHRKRCPFMCVLRSAPEVLYRAWSHLRPLQTATAFFQAARFSLVNHLRLWLYWSVVCCVWSLDRFESTLVHVSCFHPLESPLSNFVRALFCQGADYGYGYSDSPRANDRHGGGLGGGADYGGVWSSAPSHGVDENG